MDGRQTNMMFLHRRSLTGSGIIRPVPLPRSWRSTWLRLLNQLMHWKSPFSTTATISFWSGHSFFVLPTLLFSFVHIFCCITKSISFVDVARMQRQSHVFQYGDGAVAAMGHCPLKFCWNLILNRIHFKAMSLAEWHHGVIQLMIEGAHVFDNWYTVSLVTAHTKFVANSELKRKKKKFI